MNPVVAVGLILVVVLCVLGQRYCLQKKIEARRRYVDLGARCASAAGFVLDSVSEEEELHPSQSFTHKLYPSLVLYIHGSGWNISEIGSYTTLLPEPKFKGQGGDQCSVSDFIAVVEGYRSTVERRRRAVGWGCLADLTHGRNKSND